MSGNHETIISAGNSVKRFPTGLQELYLDVCEDGQPPICHQRLTGHGREEIVMERNELRLLLEQVAGGKMPIDAAMLWLKEAPFEDLGFAKLDYHRATERHPRHGRRHIQACRSLVPRPEVVGGRFFAERGVQVAG